MQKAAYASLLESQCFLGQFFSKNCVVTTLRGSTACIILAKNISNELCTRPYHRRFNWRYSALSVFEAEAQS